MGRLTVKVPDVGEGVAEVELVSWAVTDGESVARNQIVAEIMTDKATVEVPSPIDGVVGGLSAVAGDRLLVGEPLFLLEVDGRDDEEVEAPAVTPVEAPAVTSAATPAAVAAPVTRAEGRRPTATPSVRRRAREAGIDLRTVVGTGPAGRISHEDLDEVFRRPRPSSAMPVAARQADTTVSDQPVVGLRRRIAEQMVASSSTIPHITYVEEIDMTALEELRATLNGRQPAHRLTILPFLVRALVRVLPDFPMCNAHLIDGAEGPSTLRTFGGVHVGIATQTDGGLVVPVFRHAEAESLWSTAARLADLAEAARTGRASAADLSGSTITITSLGPLGGLVTTPVINKPETSIVGVNKLATRPVWDGERFVPRQMMNLSSSFDHRVVDGWDAASFVQAIKALLEQPALLFIDEGNEPDR